MFLKSGISGRVIEESEKSHGTELKFLRWTLKPLTKKRKLTLSSNQPKKKENKMKSKKSLMMRRKFMVRKLLKLKVSPAKIQLHSYTQPCSLTSKT